MAGPAHLVLDEQGDLSMAGMGAIPVFYVPRSSSDEGLEGVGNALMARLLEIQRVFERLAQISGVVSAATRDDESIAVTVKGRSIGILGINVSQARQLLDVLLHGSQPASELLNALRALAGFIYPTEDTSFTGELGYYRQREWRIISALKKHGEEIATEPTSDELRNLLLIDDDFFGRKKLFLGA